MTNMAKRLAAGPSSGYSPAERQAPKRSQTERSHEENQERAYIAASRRSDRTLEARVQSARMASEIHKKRTGKGFKITEEIVMKEEMYEEEDDDLARRHHAFGASFSGASTFGVSTMTEQDRDAIATLNRQHEINRLFAEQFPYAAQMAQSSGLQSQYFPQVSMFPNDYQLESEGVQPSQDLALFSQRLPYPDPAIHQDSFHSTTAFDAPISPTASPIPGSVSNTRTVPTRTSSCSEGDGDRAAKRARALADTSITIATLTPQGSVGSSSTAATSRYSDKDGYYPSPNQSESLLTSSSSSLSQPDRGWPETGGLDTSNGAYSFSCSPGLVSATQTQQEHPDGSFSTAASYCHYDLQQPMSTQHGDPSPSLVSSSEPAFTYPDIQEHNSNHGIGGFSVRIGSGSGTPNNVGDDWEQWITHD